LTPKFSVWLWQLGHRKLRFSRRFVLAAVHVMERQGQRLPTPGTDAAVLAAILLQAFGDEAQLDVVSITWAV
jgi:hypothetical protein